jgi:chromatin assembly factor 1 subunit B
VQGVAWDPQNQLVATQSADRSVRFHQFAKPKSGVAMPKFAIKKCEIVKMLNPLTNKASAPVVMMSDGSSDATSPSHIKGKNLFADSTVPSFFRRPAFSPDGALFMAPTGVYRPTVDKTGSLKDLPSSSFCTHVFSREHLTSPIISLSGLEEPSIAVKFSPVVYKLVRLSGEKTPVAMIGGEYRCAQ